MMETLTKELTSRFYEWEVLGRGWLLAKTPVELEPQFTPFLGHKPPMAAYVDDGIHHTVLSRVSSFFRQKELPVAIAQDEFSYDPIAFDDEDSIAVFKLHIPKEYQLAVSDIEQFLTMLTFCTSPVSIEFRATASNISMYCTCRARYAAYVKGQLKTCFFKIGISEELHDPDTILSDEKSFAITDFGLEEEFVRPLLQPRQAKVNVLTGLFSIINHLEYEQEVLVQMLFNGLVNHWEQSILKSVSNNTGGPFFENAPEMLPMAKEKITSPLLAVSIRVLTQAENSHEAMSVLEKVAFALRNGSKSAGNALIPLPHPEYTIEQRLTDIAFRESHRLGMLMSVKELSTFLHIPSLGIPKLWGKARKTKAAPQEAIGHPLVLGINAHEGKEMPVSLSNDHRLRHTHIIGATGTGKSTLLLRMIAQDIKQGNGCSVLDPHGDLIERILSIIPKERSKDVIVIDPSDTEFPVACNILFAHSAIEKEILASDLVAAFRRNSTSWGDQMNSVFANAIIAFLESTKGGTLADLRRFLIEKPYREAFLKTVTDPSIRYYWQKEYALLKTNSVGPILTRLDSFLRPRIIRNMVCQSKGLDFEHILDAKKILLVKLSQGLIGAENSYLLGTLFVSKIHQASLARQAKEVRSDFFLYIDEFHHFITPSMEEILSGGRKYHLGFVLAHQDLQQLQKQDTSLTNAIVGNAGTRICFRVGETDGKKLSDGFSSFEATNLQNLGIGEAIARIERPDIDFSFTIPNTDDLERTDLKEKILSLSRNQFSTPKVTVEDFLAKTLYQLDETTVEEKQQYTSRSPNPKPSAEKQLEPEKAPVVQETSITEKNIEQFEKRKKESQHRYLQTLIKKMAEARGFKASLEAPITNGNGKVDVLLERDHITVACEVSVTTDATWELHNMQKCLAAGYTHVVSCVIEVHEREKLRNFFKENLTQPEFSRVNVFLPEDLFAWLDESIAASPATEQTYKGYRVKVQYDQLSASEMKQKKESITKVVLESLKKMKK